ncbi:MAG: cation diffusion facilitator family transporter [Spirochaetales bacterium]|jgi:cation diffusion facilitator family transporter|nr:cation diffusion facilitator family transporter [Spirochaetales bacterium]
MPVLPDRQRQIEKASWVGIVGNALLAFISVAIGAAAGSLALVGAGLDTSSDILSSAITLYAAKIAAMPPDREHPYGHGRAETLATKGLAFIIFFAGAQLALTSFSDLINRPEKEIPGVIALGASLFSLGGKIFLFSYKARIGRRIQSSMVLADAKNMLSDVVLSASVLAGLFLTRVFQIFIIDTIMALLVSAWIMYTALVIFRESDRELMDGIKGEDIYRRIFEAVRTVPGAAKPHRVRARRLNQLYVVDMDIEVDPGLTVYQGHRIAVQIERAIKDSVENIYDIIVHVEPEGNTEAQEQYGLSEESLSEKN